MVTDFDAIVIGAGPGGEVCSARLAEGGLKTAIAERELVAGECSYWACMPSKTLLRPPEAFEAARRVPGADAAVTGELDTGAVLAWRDFMVDDWDDTEHAKWLDEKNVTLLRGDARITGPGKIDIGGEEHVAKHIIIATGSTAAIPPIDGLGELDGVWTNREAMETKKIPGSLVIVGGGPVGVELAQAFSRLGSEVTLVESNDRILPGAPVEACKALSHALGEDGVEIRLGASASSASKEGDRYRIEFEEGEAVSAERILVASGRKPNVEGLGLESVGIEPAEKGIEVDERLRAGEGVWAIGDVNGVALVTHVAKYQARLAADDILGREAEDADYRAVPKVTYTDPQVAVVGETGEGEEASVKLSSTARSSTYHRDASDRPGVVTLYSSDGEHLTGACVVGPEAGEWIGQATLAVKARVPLETMRQTIQPFPTFSEAFQTALEDLAGP